MFTKIKNKKNKNKIKTSQLERIYRNLKNNNDLMLHKQLINFFFNWDSLHERLNSHYEAWSYKKKKHKKIIGKHSIGREFQSLAV